MRINSQVRCLRHKQYIAPRSCSHFRCNFFLFFLVGINILLRKKKKTKPHLKGQLKCNMSADNTNLFDWQPARNNRSEENKLPYVSHFWVKSKTCGLWDTPPLPPSAFYGARRPLGLAWLGFLFTKINTFVAALSSKPYYQDCWKRNPCL